MRRLVLIVLCALAVAAPAAAEKNPKPKTFTAVGTLVARSATSVSVQSGTATVACSLSKTSPRLADLNVGDRVKLVCSKGFVVALGKATDTTKSDAPKTDPPATDPPKTDPPTTEPPKTDPPKTDPPKPPATTRTGQGTLSALSTTSVTVTTDGGDVTCSLGSASPKLGDFHTGDKVKFACVDGVLNVLAKVDATPPPPTNVRSAVGAITALSPTSVTVQGDGAAVTCAVGDSSPKLGDFHVGDKVKLYCVNDLVYAIVKTETAPPPPPPPTPKYTGGLGTISSLSVDRITLTTDGGPVSCYVGSSSPSTGDFHVGDRAKIYCADGVLTTIARV